MHGAYLLGGQRFAEQIDGRHLAAEDALFVQFGRRSYVTFVERLEWVWYEQTKYLYVVLCL